MDKLNQFYTQEIVSKRKYIVQKFINSTTPNGNPFDCRVHLEKNRKGEWTIPEIVIRIGLGQKVTSNVSQGGGASDPDVFFKTYYKEKADDILERLEKLGYEIAIKVEELRDTKLMTMGIDFGVDTNGDIYLFEVNGAPGIQKMRTDAVLLRTDYYKYLLSKASRLNK
ncbi:Endospore coat-associated protein YheD [Oceanobacillus oncorhynchi]|uniref:Endospore coat-associated protein YheD n=1 Tax=Oceanobacillus oncorhynchi TaxID=545501 RepID=A0A0A1MM17_9BACI|nr:Endospore coat-associated protein YheD [Oceanobacillus oncorhynchi]